jgi:hypothetical protein
MAFTGRPSINKRNREQAQRERNAAKKERRAQRSAERKAREGAAPGDDPDIASIVPGPQRPIWEE